MGPYEGIYFRRCPNCGRGVDKKDLVSFGLSSPVFECTKCGKRFCLKCAGEGYTQICPNQKKVLKKDSDFHPTKEIGYYLY